MRMTHDASEVDSSDTTKNLKGVLQRCIHSLSHIRSSVCSSKSQTTNTRVNDPTGMASQHLQVSVKQDNPVLASLFS